MTEMFWADLDLNPEPWAIGPVGASRRNGKIAAFVGRNAQLHAFEEGVAESFRSVWGERPMIEGAVSLQLFLWRDRAEYTTPQARTHRKHDADATNMQKAIEDALQGIAYKNDKQVTDVHTRVIEQGPGVEGRIVIGVGSARPASELLIHMPTQVMAARMVEKIKSQVMPLDNVNRPPWEL